MNVEVGKKCWINKGDKGIVHSEVTAVGVDADGDEYAEFEEPYSCAHLIEVLFETKEEAANGY